MTYSAKMKKALSILLCVALLFSFASAFAVHSSAEAGTYTWRIRVNVGDNFDSTSNDSKKSYLTIKGATNNGTDAPITVIETKKIAENIITDYDDGTDVYLTNLLSSSEIGASTGNTYYTTDYFPTYFYMNMYKTGHAGFGNAKFTTYLEVKNASGNWTTLCSDSASKTGGWGDMYNSATVPSNLMPSAKTVSYTKTPASTMNVPRHNEAASTSEYEAKVYDQYGVLWYEAPSFSFSTYHTGVTAMDNTVYVTSEANSNDGSNTEMQLNAQYKGLSASTKITLINASYTYRFNDVDGAQISSGTLKYGQTVPQPAAPEKAYDETNHYVFTGWTPAAGRLTGDTEFTPEFNAVKHTLLNYVSDGNATCTQDGTKTATCTCGYQKTVADVGSKKGHSYFEEVTTEPTCTEKGVRTFTCIRGDHSYTQDIDPTGHDYQAQVIEPTCTTKGYTLYTCSNCSDSYAENYTDALGHQWNEGEQTTAPTCTQEGVYTYTCTRCPETLTEPVAALGHYVKSWTIRNFATCEEPGERFGKCTRTQCKETITQEIPAFGHSWSDWHDDTDPTCEEAGYYSRVCLICEKDEHQDIAPLGHLWEFETKKPDDGQEGMFYYKCIRPNCDKCATCVINDEGEKDVGEVCVPEELEEKTIDVPTTTFNNFERPDGEYNYFNRGGSLRIDPDSLPDYQAMRFCSSMTVPKGAEILDFGYIYTREDHFQTLKDFVLDGEYVYSSSLINGKYSTFTTAEGEVRTFNIVLNIHKDNWGYKYIARPYIIYRFAGETFTVYDIIYASRSVNYIADKVLNSPTESKYVKDYIKAKGLAGNIEIS